MSAIELISLYAMTAVYVFAGISHLRWPKLFLRIMPKWVPFPEKVNVFVGVAEMALGVGLLLPNTREFAALGIIALLLAVFPANVYHFQQARSSGKHVFPTLLRLPLQGVLIYWAYSFV